MIMIGNETDLHYKVMDLIRRFYPNTILVAGLGKIKTLKIKGWTHIRKDICAASLI